jgi:hypothetical protein
MTCTPATDALYYPFHLCHERTLAQALERFQRVHFRDYMALRLNRFSGTAAYADRMGGCFPGLVAGGRLIQGYDVSGPLSRDTAEAVDRDLRDLRWRAIFHQALAVDRRFQRGLFDVSHAVSIGNTQAPWPAALLILLDESRRDRPYDVAGLSRLGDHPLAGEAAYDFEYGLALLKTSAALAYTVQLSVSRTLAVVTDSDAHYALLERTAEREGITLANHLIVRAGY